MGDRLRRLPSPSMAVAFAALLAALGGTAVALPGSNTVTSGDIVTGGVKTSDIKNSAIQGKDVKANTLTGSDVSESSLGEVPSATNADTAANATNAANAANAGNADNLGGTQAAAHLRDIRMVSNVSASNSTTTKSVSASCLLGEEVVGGGGFIDGTPAVEENVVVRESYPFQSFQIFNVTIPDGYTAIGSEINPDAGSWTVTARALCAKG
jgi:hypothetical protein